MEIYGKLVLKDIIQRPRSLWQASFSQCRPRAVQPSSSGKTEKNKEHFPLFLNAVKS